MEFMTAYQREEMVREANQKAINEQLQARQQIKQDLLEGTKQLAEEREARLKELADKQNQYKEQPPLSEAEELQQLKERAKAEDARAELEALRKRFAGKDGK